MLFLFAGMSTCGIPAFAASMTEKYKRNVQNSQNITKAPGMRHDIIMPYSFSEVLT